MKRIDHRAEFSGVSSSRMFDPLTLDNAPSFQPVISVFSDLVASPSLRPRARFTMSRRWRMDEKRSRHEGGRANGAGGRRVRGDVFRGERKKEKGVLACESE